MTANATKRLKKLRISQKTERLRISPKTAEKLRISSTTWSKIMANVSSVPILAPWGSHGERTWTDAAV